jgi:aspartyl-tRNA(Asn)/glutamyl-tRNA(Gln) amidotransferase subunit A
MSARQLAAAYRERSLSPTEVAEAVLGHINDYGPAINAFAHLDPGETLRQAALSSERWAKGAPLGPLDGVPVSIKDLLLTKEWPTRFGSKTTAANGPWTEDAPCVARLREGGAVFIGKTTTSEFGGSGFPWSPLTGLTRNPCDPGRACGASSAGAGAATAAGFGALAMATDGMGSIRIPASFNGVFGMKPTFGLVPAYPYGLAADLSSVGPMTRSVADAALALNVVTQPDIRDWTALPYTPMDYVQALECDLSGLRVALSMTMGFAEVDQPVADAVNRAAWLLEKCGAKVVEIDPPLTDPLPIFDTIRMANRSTMVAQLTPEKRALMDPILAGIGRADSLTVARFRTAMQERAVYGMKMQEFLGQYDVLITPTMPIPPLPVTTKHDDPASDQWYMVGGRMWAPFSLPFNLTQQPAASLPCALDGDGLPFGMQIVAAKYRDSLVLQVCHALEQMLAFPADFAIKRLRNSPRARGDVSSH